MIEIIRLIFNPAVVWVFIPLVAIIGGLYVSIRKEEIKSRGMLKSEDLEALKSLVQKNKDLTERVESLESIITSMDKELLALKAADTDDRQRVKELSDKMKGIV